MLYIYTFSFLKRDEAFRFVRRLFFFNQVEDNILKCECVELKGF